MYKGSQLSFDVVRFVDKEFDSVEKLHIFLKITSLNVKYNAKIVNTAYGKKYIIILQ